MAMQFFLVILTATSVTSLRLQTQEEPGTNVCDKIHQPSTVEYDFSAFLHHDPTAGHKIRDYSQVGQDKRIANILKPISKGFFVESGAHDGLSWSNTLKFERQLGWTGLLVEPNPGPFSKLMSLNRKAFAFNGGLSTTGEPGLLNFSGEGQTFHISNEHDPKPPAPHRDSPTSPTPTNQKTNSTISMARAKTPPKQQQRHIKGKKHNRKMSLDGQEEEDLENIADVEFADFSVPVPLQPLENLLSCLGKKTVDFWSLDVEGVELPILKAFPFKDIEVGVMLVEVGEHSTQDQNEIMKTMESNGFYQCGVVIVEFNAILDRIFVNPAYYKNRGLEPPKIC